MKNLRSSSLLSKIIKIKTQRTVILSIILYGYENWSHIEGGTLVKGIPE